MKTVYELYRGYVKLSNGNFAVQIPNNNSSYGFYLTMAYEDGSSQSWDGGIGIGAESWEIISPEEVPENIKNLLEWLLEQ